MGKVTACKMDVITKKSGHTMTGCAVSVCITPAAPSPIPIPYPTVGTVAEGITDPCLRTKIGGAIVMTVGSCMAKCHGNEPGTLKEVVSLNTAGPCFPFMGAPMVFMELGMAGITTSPGQMNKSITVGASGSASGAGGGGSGAGGGAGGGAGPPGASTQGPAGGGGGGGGSNSGAAPPSPPASPTADGQASAAHPIDVVTGSLYTHHRRDFMLPGPLVVSFERWYTSAGVETDVGFGHGWTHSLDWTAEREGDALTIRAPGAQVIRARMPGDDEIVILPQGMRLSRKADNLFLDCGDGQYRVLGPQGALYYLVQVRDDYGNHATVEWDGGRVARIVDSVGREAVLVRDGSFHRWEVRAKGPDGTLHEHRAVTYELDERGDLTRVIDAGGGEVRYRYDEEHYLTAECLPDGVVYHFVHAAVDGEKRCVESWGELVGGDILREIGAAPIQGIRGIYHARLEYRPQARETIVIDGLGQRHFYRGNAFGLVEQYVDPRGTTLTYHYDDVGKLIAARDGAGRIVRKRFDPAGRPAGMTRPDDGRWIDRFDDEAGTIERTRPDGAREEYRYRRGRLESKVDAEGRESTLSWDERGCLLEAARPGQGSHRYEYDAHKNLSRVTLPSGAEAKYTFDVFGCPVEIESAQGVTYRFAYDSRFDLVRIEEPGGKVTEIEIDAARNVVGRSDAGGVTTFRHVAGALVETVRRDGRRWLLGYDPLLRLTWIENPAGERYSRVYDGAGLVVRETSFAGLTSTYERDGSGYVVRVEESDGSWIRIERDPEGRVLSEEHSDGTTQHFRYDAMGALVAARNPLASVRFERDVEGRILREVTEAGGFAFAAVHRFDEAGRLVGRDYSSGWKVDLERRPDDGLPVVVTARGTEEEALRLEHDLRGNEISRHRESAPAGVRFERDPYGMPTRAVVEVGGEPVRERGWRWHPIGPAAEVVDDRRGARRYELDPEGRPLEARGLGVTARYEVSAQGTVVPAESGWSVGRDGRPTRAGAAELVWDARGRLAERREPEASKSWQYQWDGRDRLVAARRGDGLEVTYLYDPLGRCIAQQLGDDSSVWFGWDGDQMVEERPSTGASVQRVFAEDGYSPLLEGRDQGDWRMALTDAAGTPWLFLHRDGEQSEIDLDPFGALARASGDPGAIRLAGQRADAVTGLHYNRHRWYDPSLHVFLSPDPLGIAGSMQDVGFVPNVTIYVDPDGLTTIVVGAPGDAGIMSNMQIIQQRYPGARVLRHDELTPGSLDNEDHVIVQTHGAPGVLEWGDGNYANGQVVGNALRNAGFGNASGARVELSACNSATPQQGGGLSTAQQVARATGRPVSGASSNDPAATYAGTTEAGPGGYQWGPGMLAPSTQGSGYYVHNGTWTTTQPRLRDCVSAWWNRPSPQP